MRREVHTDRRLGVEVYHFQGLTQTFPSHFHDYYLFGLVETGERLLTCGGNDWPIGPGDLILFNPGESHSCTQTDGGQLDYRGVCIYPQTARKLTQELTGRAYLPAFRPKAVRGERALADGLKELHRAFTQEEEPLRKEELLLVTFEGFLSRFCDGPVQELPACRREILTVCRYLEEHYAQPVQLEQLARLAGLSSSALVRAFVRERGITPYRYLETVRVNRARELLEQGVPPAQAALQVGFADQSHLGRYFARLMGVTPGTYRAGLPDREKKEI